MNYALFVYGGNYKLNNYRHFIPSDIPILDSEKRDRVECFILNST